MLKEEKKEMVCVPVCVLISDAVCLPVFLAAESVCMHILHDPSQRSCECTECTSAVPVDVYIGTSNSGTSLQHTQANPDSKYL